MIGISPNYEKKVVKNLSKYPEIVEIQPIFGKHDVIAKIKINDYEKLGSFVINKIRIIEGIKNTRTLTGAFSLTSFIL